MEEARLSRRGLALRSALPSGPPMRSRALASLLLVVLCGCGSAGPRPPETQFRPFDEAERELAHQARSARYHIRPGDILSVDFQYMDDLDRAGIMVLPDGYISMPGVDGLRASGLTLAELDSALTAQFAPLYVSPDLSVVVDKLGSRKIYVLGEVNHPGLYELEAEGGDPIQAIAMAGGFTQDAAKSETILMRVGLEGFYFTRLDLAHLEQHGYPVLANMPLAANDVIYVPRSAVGDFAYFTKNVLGGALSVSGLFWDVYAIINIDKIDRVVR